MPKIRISCTAKKSTLIALTTFLFFTGCAQNAPEKTPTVTTAEENVASKVPTGIDVDLTQMSSEEVETAVLSLMEEPTNDFGKTVKIAGTTTSYVIGDTSYHSVIVKEALDSCPQGIEYRTADDNYPPDGEEVTITGELGWYTEGSNLYIVITATEVDL